MTSVVKVPHAYRQRVAMSMIRIKQHITGLRPYRLVDTGGNKK